MASQKPKTGQEAHDLYNKMSDKQWTSYMEELRIQKSRWQTTEDSIQNWTTLCGVPFTSRVAARSPFGIPLKNNSKWVREKPRKEHELLADLRSHFLEGAPLPDRPSAPNVT